MLMGSLFVLMGLFALAVSGVLSRWATNWNLFLRTEDMDAYRTTKHRRIRISAKIILVFGSVVIVVGLFAWVPQLA